MSARSRYRPWFTDGRPRVPPGVRRMDCLMAHAAITFTRVWLLDAAALPRIASGVVLASPREGWWWH